MAETASVLLLSPSAKPGGAERVLASLAKRLATIGFAPALVLLEHGPAEPWFTEVGCDLSVIPAGRARELPNLSRTLWRLRAMIHDSGAQVVISNMAKGHLYGGLAALGSGVPSVWWQHGIPARTKFEMAAAMVPSAAVVCSCGRAVDAQRKLTPRRRVVRLYPGVNVEQVAARRGSGRELRRTLGWDANTVVGIVGRLQSGKGQDVFLGAAAIIARAHPDVRFLVVGGAVLGWEGDYPERLKELARDLGLGENIRFTGHQADVYPWFDALDVVVHASIGDGFGLVLVEAMALGKPLVATADGGPTEIVEDGVSGLLVPPGDAPALADGVMRILADPALAARLARGAAERATHFDEAQMAAGMAHILGEVLSKRSGRPSRLLAR